MISNRDKVETLLRETGSKYILTTAIFKRAKELVGGAKVLIEDIGRKPEILAMDEISEGKVEISYDPNAAATKKAAREAAAAEVEAATAAEESAATAEPASTPAPAPTEQA
ncbi:MAG: DNA-directed RNA polymerase subunit omega [Candidatus Lindowbacteria bacterium]|nr:DNA-directed RNA polymerase subunit omega [Candidatus Lindowbacteria bacterium]